ncbi:8092_t:CDS:2, partial [Rhizophagus irregularis]
KVHRRLQNIDTSKIPSMQDLADVIVMLSMRPAEVLSFQIINYKPDSEDLPAWYKAGYSWYCTGCHKQRDKQMPMRLLSMEKDPEHARKLLTWIQDAIKAGKLRDPVYTETGKCNNVPFVKFIKSLKTNQDEDEITPKVLRKIGAKHTSMKEPKSEPETGDGLNPQTQASSPASQSRNNDPKKSQTMDMDSMLAEIDAMLAEIRK